RPSPKRVPHGPAGLPFVTASVEGPMARNVPDVALMLDAMVGEHISDPGSLPAPAISYVEGLKNIPKFGKVAYSPDLGQCPIDQEVAEICAKAAEDFSQYCAGVEEDCFDLTGGDDIFQVIRAAQFAASHATKLETHLEHLKPEIIWNIEKGMNLTGGEIGRAHREQGALYHRVVDFFATYDVLLCPTVMAPPFDHSLRYLEEVNGQKFDNYIAWLAMTYLLTITACPSISLPCGFTKSGLPVGLQIMAPNGREDIVLKAAYAYERDHDFAGRVPLSPITPA
ncbi:MAG: amidase, partial [Sneathiella sp.]